MAPENRSRFDDTTLEHFERYCVEGDTALSDPAVAHTASQHRDVVARLRPVVVELRAQSRLVTDHSFLHALERIQNPNASSRSSARSVGTFRRSVLRSGWVMASIVCVVTLALIAGWYQHASNRVAALPMGNVANTVMYSAANGQRTSIDLPDGSHVVLNSGSELTVPYDFGSRHRTLNLQGEALFTVAHENQTPFIVMAGAIMTRVLGTTFVVRHYRTDTVTSVAVQDGKVAVQSVVVPAQWQANVASSGSITLTEASKGRFTFASGALTLDDASLPDAIVELERWYNADIRLAHPSLAEHRVTAIFHEGSLADLAMVLELALDVRINRAGRTLILYPKGS